MVQRSLLKLARGGGGETWGVHVDALPAGTVSSGDTFSASAIKALVEQMATDDGGFNWPGGTVPSIGRMLDDSNFLITQSGSFSLPAGNYRVEVVGGGAPGAPATASGSGAGGNSSIPVVSQLALQTAATVSAVIGSSASDSTFTSPSGVITGYAGSGYGAPGVAYTTGTNGDITKHLSNAGYAFVYSGGGKASAQSGGARCSADATLSTPMYVAAGSSGSGSRLSLYFAALDHALLSYGEKIEYLSVDKFSPKLYVFMGTAGKGYGAGGGGGCGAYRAAVTGSASTCTTAYAEYKEGGPGAPGCILITVL